VNDSKKGKGKDNSRSFAPLRMTTTLQRSDDQVLAAVGGVAYGVAQGYVEIEQAKAGDYSADPALRHESYQRGRRSEERVCVPGGGEPRREADEKSKVHAYDDAEEALCLLKPVGNALRTVLLGRDLHGWQLGRISGRGGGCGLHRSVLYRT
jgi:hypothetical protein